jgi:hypothetical protein
MTREGCRLLDNGDTFPEMEIKCIERENLVLPRDLGPRWNVLLFYRGHW